MHDIRQSLNYANYLEREGWTVERVDSINYFIRRIPFVGSVIKLQRPSKISMKTLLLLSEKYKAFEVIVEPGLASNSKAANITEKLFSENGFKLSKSPYLPSKTLVLDLKQSKEKIYKTFKKDARRAVKRGVGVEIKEYSSPGEIKTWHEAWKNSVNFKKHVPGLKQLLNIKKSFPQSNSLFLASHNISGRIIGGALFTTSSHERSNYITYYWYGFTNKEGRTSLSQYSLLYQGILWGKRIGSAVFDFEGIFDSRFPNKSWLGFTHFKKSFGGIEVEYPGAYIKFKLPSFG